MLFLLSFDFFKKIGLVSPIDYKKASDFSEAFFVVYFPAKLAGKKNSRRNLKPLFVICFPANWRGNKKVSGFF